MELTFTQIDRSVIKMLFIRGLVNEVRGAITHDNKPYNWEIIKREKCDYRDEEYYHVAFGHEYHWHRCDSLDEAMDRLEDLARRHPV